MKQLLLYRHGKSSWDDPDLEDFDRPLAKRGRKAAPLMGRTLAARDLVPDRVLCSAAVRTRETWELTAGEFGAMPEAKTLRSLYLASPAQILQQVHRTSDTVQRLMVVGHNPGLENLALRLAGGMGDSPDLELMRAKFPTCALAVIRLDAARWAETGPETTRLDAFLRPKDLQGA
jgi:phosphohistidine phosphatase